MHELYEGKGPMVEVPSHRDVTLGNLLGKNYSKGLRKDAKPFMNTNSLDTQFGSGIHGGGCDTAHLYLRAMADVAVARKQCCAFVFVDVVTAFASMVRQVAMSDMSDVTVLAAFLEKLGCERCRDQ